MRISKKHKQIYICILIGFFTLIISLHVIRDKQQDSVIEGLGDNNVPTSDNQGYITPPTSTTNSPQYTTTQQSGEISTLKKKADSIDAKLTELQSKINTINLAAANNCKKLEADAKSKDKDDTTK